MHSKKSKKNDAKGSVALLKDSFQLGCVSQDAHPSKSMLRNGRQLGSNRAVTFSKGTWAPDRKFGNERVHREESFKSVNLMSAVLAPRFEERSQDETLHMGRGDNVYKLKDPDKASFGSPIESTSSRRRPFQNLQRNENSWSIPEHQCTC